MKNAVFWDVEPCKSCEMNRLFIGTYLLHLQGRKFSERRAIVILARGFFYLENGGDTFLRNVGSFHRLYTAPHPRRRHSS
jgi:hypothetical protein